MLSHRKARIRNERSAVLPKSYSFKSAKQASVYILPKKKQSKHGIAV